MQGQLRFMPIPSLIQRTHLTEIALIPDHVTDRLQTHTQLLFDNWLVLSITTSLMISTIEFLRFDCNLILCLSWFCLFFFSLNFWLRPSTEITRIACVVAFEDLSWLSVFKSHYCELKFIFWQFVSQSKKKKIRTNNILKKKLQKKSISRVSMR